MILAASEALIFLLLVQSTYGIQARGEWASGEASKASMARELEFLSYNALLDFCVAMKAAAKGFPENGGLTAMGGLIAGSAEGWRVMMEAYIENRVRGSVEIIINVTTAEYEGQPVDRFEMSYIGSTSTAKWFIAGELCISIQAGDWRRSDSYGIRIAV